MKKLIFVIGFMLFASIIMQAQHNDMKRLFNNFKKTDGFTLKIVDPGIEIECAEMNDFMHFLNDTKEIYILEFENEIGEMEDYKKFNTKLKKLIKKYNFESMLELNGGDNEVKIYVRKKTNEKVSNFLLLTQNEDGAVVVWTTMP